MDKYDVAYLKMAEAMAETSEAKRLKVGSIIVKDNKVVSCGVNGTPAGWFTNQCETEDGTTDLVVIHSEMNCLMKAAKTGSITDGATMYITHSSCANCAKHMIAAGIKKVVYKHDYRDTTGLSFLHTAGVEVYKVTN